MKGSRSLAAGVVALAACTLGPGSLLAGGQVGGAAQGEPPRWERPRMPWGHPDIQGVWDSTTGTPLERPAEFAGREFLTDEEAQARERRRFAGFDSPDRGPGNPTGDYGSEWREGSRNALNRTSLILEPSDGRLPPLTEAGRRALEERRQARSRRGPADSHEDLSLWTRCLTRGTPRIPNNYNSNWHILQTPEAVVIHQEMIHETRIVLLDGRPHVPDAVRLWNGDSRGRWEGDTLVVESTRFNGRQEFRGLSLSKARLVERFTRTGPATLDYRFTLEDASTYTSPFTVGLPMVLNTAPYFEYACHEGNYGLTYILSGHRAQERAAGLR